MEEHEVKRKIQLLYAIKPNEDWVILTRNRFASPQKEVGINALQMRGFWGIVRHVTGVFGRYIERPVFIMPALAFMVAGGAMWHGASASLPGDALYPIRASIEQIPLSFVPKDRQFPEFDLAQQRLADLGVVAKQNKIKNLPSAILEFEANVSKASEGFLKIVENRPQNALQASRQMVELQKEKLEIEKILGTKIGQEQEREIEGTLRKLVENEIGYLEARSLTEEQETLFERAKAFVDDEKYGQALEVIWKISQTE